AEVCTPSLHDALPILNVGEEALLYRFMKRVSRWVYRRADMLIYSSKRFQGYLRDVHGIEVDDAQYMPQFADDVFRAPLPPKPARSEEHTSELQSRFDL